MKSKTRVAAIEGLFTLDASEPRLLGTRCQSCGSYFFPAELVFCRNPSCDEAALEQVELSSTGTLWSWTGANYAPPAPYVAKEPFEPFAIAAVTLEREGLTILGQVADGLGAGALRAGMPMKLVLGELYEDDAKVYLTWRWKPMGAQ